ncbi:hypothetical protein G7Y79_00001g002020 [Physcia stellaris]|nr:hypothetical protein G7Y79_00001g002020 [Physcia stellaris]
MSRLQEDFARSPHNGSILSNSPNTTTLRRKPPGRRVPHICVVGAGMAGLRCAEILTRHGLKVTILEARDRIGGRVHQSDHLGHLADLGPNWIHGADQNPILALAEETATTTFHPEDESSSVYDEYESASIPQERSLMDYFLSSLKDQKLGEASSSLVLQMARIWGDYIGDPIEKQSLKYLWLEECIDGENLFVANTYKPILDRIAKSALTKAELHLSTKVTKVASNTKPDDGVAVSTNTNDTPLLYDEVVVTAPLGYLKRNLSIFSPPLPNQLTRAIAHISYGRLEKVYITFPAAYWTTNHANNDFFTNFLHPTYAKSQNPSAWSLECVSLAALPTNHAHPTLLFYLHGPCAAHITSLINNLPPTTPEYYTRLNAFFTPYYALLPHYSATSPSCVPAAFLTTNWQNDELAGYGSYSNFQVASSGEQVLLDSDIEALRYGAPERRVWFAGEHTAPFVALGTVTGAYWSGEAVAGRILRGYGMADGGEGDVGVVGGGGEVGKGGEGKGTGFGDGLVGL